MIDAKENRDIYTCKMTGTFMQEDMHEMIHVRITGPLATILVQVDSNKYDKGIKNKNRIPVIYLRLKNALYGTLKAALLLWKKLTRTLTKWSFEMSPYD